MATQIQLGDITIEVVQKKIKNLHLTVHPPDGRVRIAAPLHLDADTIRIYAISKLDWIKKHRRKIQEQPREAPRDFLDRESHYVWGKRYLLEVIEEDTPPAVQLGHGKLRLTLRPGINTARREAILAAWYRNLLKEAIPPLIAAWEPRLRRWLQCAPHENQMG
jgi:predicted metal-dependent hydrolase